jgi:predicted PurR-regulated permease PerM
MYSYSTSNGTAGPSYPMKLAAILICVVLIVFISAKLQVIFVPIIFSSIFSVMLYPLTCRLEKWGLSKALAAAVSVMVGSVACGALIYFLCTQVSALNDQAPQLMEKVDLAVKKMQLHVSSHYGINKSQQSEQLQHQIDNLANNGAKIITGAIKAIASFVTDVMLIPLFVFFILYFRSFFLDFFYRAFSSADRGIIDEVFGKMYAIIQSWLVGLIVVMGIVGTLNTVGLLILGVPYAALFGFLAAVLLLIPYVGITVGAILPAIMAIITKDSYWYAVGVILVFWFIQLLEGNLITPYVVGSKISINPLVSILALILFGNLWGISGLILALPITAMCKVIFDAVPGMKPFGFLIGVPRKHHLKANPIVRLRPMGKYRKFQTLKPRIGRQTPVEEE